MAVGDREAELKIKATLEGGKQVAEGIAAAREEAEKLGDAAGQLAGSLSGAADATDEVAAAERRVAQESSEAAGALRNLGAAGESSGQEIAAGAGAAAAQVGRIGDAAAEAATETTAANQKAESSVEQVTAALREQFQQIRSGTLTLEEQRGELQFLENELKEVATGYRATTDTSRAHAEASRIALAEVRQHLVQVNTAIDEQGSKYGGLSAKGRAALESIKGETVSVEQALIAAANAVKRADAELASTGKLGPRAVGNITQAVENYRMTVIAARGSIEAARDSEVAGLRELETHLERVTLRSNQLVNASRDQQVQLKETGHRITGVTMVAQDLGRVLGPTGEAVGNAVARIGMLGANAEQAKDALHGLDLNTLSTTKSALGLGVQSAALVATFAAAVAGGLKLAETNEENKEVIDDLTDSIKAVLPALQDLAKEGAKAFGALQGEWQKSAASAELLNQAILDLNFDDASRWAGNLANDFRSMAAGITGGTEASKLFRAAMQAGATGAEAHTIAVTDTSRALELLQIAQAAGNQGLTLWEQAVRNSGGTSEGFRAQLDQLGSSLNLLTIEYDQQVDSHVRLRAAIEQTKAAQHALAMANLASLQADYDKADAVTKTIQELYGMERAVNGTTKAITSGAAEIAKYAGATDVHSVTLAKLAAALSDVTSKVDGLTKAERERIDMLIELASRGATLTEQERARVQQLAKSIITGEAVTDTLRQQVAVTRDLADAESNVTSAMKGREVAEERQIYWAKTGNEQKEKDVRTSAEMFAALSNENMVYGEVAESVERVAEVTTKSAQTVSAANQAWLESGSNIEHIGDSADATATSIQGVGEAVAETSDPLISGLRAWITEGERLTVLDTSLAGINDRLKELRVNAEETAPALDKLAESVDKLALSADTASSRENTPANEG